MSKPPSFVVAAVRSRPGALSRRSPFYTGKQKFVDTAGRVEKFQKKYNWGKKQES
jgi:hypothetical protein